jgi:polyhydroxybutyrate depolymerase
MTTMLHWLRTTWHHRPHLQGRAEPWHLQAGGRERRALAYRHAGARTGGAAWLLLHGSRSDGATMREFTGHSFDRLVDEQGGIAVYPDGVEGHWNDGRCHAPFVARRQQVDDIAFVRTLARRLREEAQGRPVYGVGFSNGGHLLYRLAAEAPTLLDGSVVIGANLSAPGQTDHQLARLNAPLLLVAGTADRVNPFRGGMTRLFLSRRGRVLSFVESLERLQEMAAPCVAVRGLVLPDAGHTVPQPHARLPRLLGRTAHYLDIAQQAAHFFRTATA